MIKLLSLLVILCGTTIFLESIPILFLKNKKVWWKASVLCNVVTNPILNVIVLLLPIVLLDFRLLKVIVFFLEIVVVLFESWFYQLMLGKSNKACLLFSLAANGLSFVVGSMLNSLAIFY